MRQTGTYKTVDELPNLLTKEKPQQTYQSVDELPDLKKKVSGDGLKEPSDGVLGGTTPKTEPIPTITQDKLDEQDDVIGKIQEADALSKKTRFWGMGGGGGEVPDFDAISKSKEIHNQLKGMGYGDNDIELLTKTFSDLPKEAETRSVMQQDGTVAYPYSKKSFLELYKTNPIAAVTKANNVKNFYELRSAVGEAKASEYNKLAYVNDETKPINANIDNFNQLKEKQKELINSSLPKEKRQKALDRVEENSDIILSNIFQDENNAKNYLIGKLQQKDATLKLANPTVMEAEGKVDGDLGKFSLESIADNLDPKNKAENLAFRKYKYSVDLDNAVNSSADLNQAALTFAAEQNPQIKGQLEKLGGTRLPNAYEGEIVNEFLNSPDVIKRAESDPIFAEKYNIGKSNLYFNYPDFAKKEVATKISQEMEDRGMTNWFANIPTKEGTDKLVDDLVRTGKLTEQDKLVYEKQIRDDLGVWQSVKRGVGRIPFGAFIEESPIQTPGLLESTQNAFNKTVHGIARSVEDVINIPAGGEAFSAKERLYNKLQEDASMVNLIPKSTLHEVSMGTGHLAGFVIPMMAGGAALRGVKGAEFISQGLMFEGPNKENALKLFPDDPTKQYTYTAIATAGDMMLGHLIPKGDAAKGISKTLKGDIVDVVNKFTNKEITAAQAKQTLLNKTTSLLGDLAKENTKVAATMSIGFGAFHNTLDALFGANNMSAGDIATQAVKDFKSTFLTTPILAAMAVKGRASGIDGKILMEVASNPELYKKVIAEQSALNPELKATEKERLQNLEDAALIKKDLDNTEMNDKQKEEFMVTAINKKILERKAAGITDKTLKQSVLDQAEKHDTNLVLLKSEFGDKEFKDLTPEERDRIEPPKDHTVKTQPSGTEGKFTPVIINKKGEHEVLNKSFDTPEAAKVYGEETVKKRYFDENIKNQPEPVELPNLSQPIEGVDEFGVPIGENVPPEVKGEPEQITQPIELSVEPSGEVKPLTKEAEDLLASIGEGSKPTFITKNLERIAKENGIEVTDKMSADDVINALKEKQISNEAKANTTVSDVSGKTKERNKIIQNHLLDNDGDIDGAFGKVGYVNVNGIWVAPEAVEYARKVSPKVWQQLKDKGIKYLEGGDDGRGLQKTISYDNKNIRGIGVNENVGDGHSGHDHTVLHETAHHVWQEELTPEQKAVFGDDNPVSDYAKSVKDGKEKTLAKHDEEDFAELFAKNNGDVDAAIAEKKAQSLKEQTKQSGDGKPNKTQPTNEAKAKEQGTETTIPESTQTTGQGNAETTTTVLTKEAEDLLASVGEGSMPTFITKNLEKIAADNGVVITDKMTAVDVINALKEKQSQPTVTNKEQIPNEPITEPVTKPISEVTETAKEQGVKEAVPEGTIETGRTEPEGTAAVLDADVKKAILDAAIDKKSEKGKQMAMEEEAAKYGKQGAKILSEIRGGEPPKPPTGEFKTVEDIGGQDLSGIRKALVSDKIIEGVDLERVSDKEMMSMGRKILDTGEIKPEALVEKIITDGKGVLTPTEVVGLITYKRDIDNALQDTYTKIAEKKAKGEDIGTLGVEAKNLERQIHDFDVMAVITAQQQSMAFRLRQRMLDREYNVVTQIEKYKANNNGKIPADVEAKFRELDKQLKDVKDKLIDAEKRLSEKEGQDAVNNIKESVEREKTYTEEELDKKINEGVEKEIAKLYEELPSGKKSAADKAIKALEKFREKIKGRTYESTLGIPMAIADLGAATAIRAIKVGKTVAEAVEIGINRIKKALKEKGIDTWEKESEYRKDLTTTLEEEGVSTKKKPKDKPVINEDGTVSIPNEMLRDLVKRGITDINDLTKAVHDQVKKDLPDISERQVRDYITDYGKKVNPTADEIQTQVNIAKRVGRLLSELEDLKTMGKAEFFAKYRKPKPSDSKITEREQELKRKIKSLGNDIVVDLGTKDSDTKHQNRIEYLEKELLRIQERRKKEPKENKESTREIPEDEKLLLEEIEKEQAVWDSEKDAARAASNDYKKMETERNRQLKRVEEINEKIAILKTGKLPETKSGEVKKDTPEIEELKAEKDALEKSVRESIAHENKMNDLETELQRLKDRKAKEPKPESKRVISEEERLKRDEIDAEKKAWNIENNIEKLNKELQLVRNRQKKVTSPNERRELTITEKDLVKQINAEKEVWRKEVEPEKKVRQALKDAQKSLDEYERRIAEKDFSKKTESATPETPELKALREKRDAKRKEYEKLKKDSVPKIPKTEAERLKSAKESVKRRITDLETKIKNKDFAKPAKKLQPTDNELVELNAEKERLQEEFDKEQYALELKNRNIWQKWEDRAYEATSGLMRGLTLGVDLSAAGVQGMRRLFTNPKESAIAFWDGLKFLVSEKGANEYMDKQKAQPYYPLLRATKLAIDDKSGKQSVKEGMFVSEWINFIWNKAIAPVAGLGTKWGTDFVRKINPYAASQRAYDGYVNSIRIQTYLKLAKELSRDGYTYETDPKVFDKMADFVNTTTGRGSLGAADANSRWLNVFLTAPRKVISEVKLYTPYAFVYYARMPKAVRMKALKDFAQFTGTFLAVNALMWASRKNWDNDEDDDNFWNMNSSDFLTHKFGDKRVSIGGGMKSILTMQARFLTGKYTDQYGVTTKLGDRYGKPINTRLDLLTRFAIGKAAPVFNVLAKKLDERAGRPVENEEIIKNISVPLWIQDVGDLYKNDPNSVAPLLMTLSILGANVRTVDKSKSQLQSEELSKEPIFKEYIDKGVNFPELNPEKIQTKEVNGKVIEKLSDYDTKIQEDFIKKKKEYLKQEFLKLKNGTIKVYVDNDGNATTTPSRNKKLKPFNQLTKEQIQNVISTSISGNVTEKVKKEVLKDKKPKK